MSINCWEPCFGTEEDRADLVAGHVANGERVVHAINHARLLPAHCVVRRVLKADSCVAITCPAQARQHLELDAVSPSRLGDHIPLQREEDPTQDGPHYRRDCRDLIGNGVQLLLATDIHRARLEDSVAGACAVALGSTAKQSRMRIV